MYSNVYEYIYICIHPYIYMYICMFILIDINFDITMHIFIIYLKSPFPLCLNCFLAQSWHMTSKQSQYSITDCLVVDSFVLQTKHDING